MSSTLTPETSGLTVGRGLLTVEGAAEGGGRGDRRRSSGVSVSSAGTAEFFNDRINQPHGLDDDDDDQMKTLVDNDNNHNVEPDPSFDSLRPFNTTSRQMATMPTFAVFGSGDPSPPRQVPGDSALHQAAMQPFIDQSAHPNAVPDETLLPGVAISSAASAHPRHSHPFKPHDFDDVKSPLQGPLPPSTLLRTSSPSDHSGGGVGGGLRSAGLPTATKSGSTSDHGGFGDSFKGPSTTPPFLSPQQFTIPPATSTSGVRLSLVSAHNGSLLQQSQNPLIGDDRNRRPQQQQQAQQQPHRNSTNPSVVAASNNMMPNQLGIASRSDMRLSLSGIGSEHGIVIPQAEGILSTGPLANIVNERAAMAAMMANSARRNSMNGSTSLNRNPLASLVGVSAMTSPSRVSPRHSRGFAEGGGVGTPRHSHSGGSTPQTGPVTPQSLFHILAQPPGTFASAIEPVRHRQASSGGADIGHSGSSLRAGDANQRKSLLNIELHSESPEHHPFRTSLPTRDSSEGMGSGSSKPEIRASLAGVTVLPAPSSNPQSTSTTPTSASGQATLAASAGLAGLIPLPATSPTHASSAGKGILKRAGSRGVRVMMDDGTVVTEYEKQRASPIDGGEDANIDITGSYDAPVVGSTIQPTGMGMASSSGLEAVPGSSTTLFSKPTSSALSATAVGSGSGAISAMKLILPPAMLLQGGGGESEFFKTDHDDDDDDDDVEEDHPAHLHSHSILHVDSVSNSPMPDGALGGVGGGVGSYHHSSEVQLKRLERQLAKEDRRAMSSLLLDRSPLERGLGRISSREDLPTHDDFVFDPSGEQTELSNTGRHSTGRDGDDIGGGPGDAPHHHHRWLSLHTITVSDIIRAAGGLNPWLITFFLFMFFCSFFFALFVFVFYTSLNTVVLSPANYDALLRQVDFWALLPSDQQREKLTAMWKAIEAGNGATFFQQAQIPYWTPNISNTTMTTAMMTYPLVKASIGSLFIRLFYCWGIWQAETQAFELSLPGSEHGCTTTLYIMPLALLCCIIFVSVAAFWWIPNERRKATKHVALLIQLLERINKPLRQEELVKIDARRSTGTSPKLTGSKKLKGWGIRTSVAVNPTDVTMPPVILMETPPAAGNSLVFPVGITTNTPANNNNNSASNNTTNNNVNNDTDVVPTQEGPFPSTAASSPTKPKYEHRYGPLHERAAIIDRIIDVAIDVRRHGSFDEDRAEMMSASFKRPGGAFPPVEGTELGVAGGVSGGGGGGGITTMVVGNSSSFNAFSHQHYGSPDDSVTRGGTWVEHRRSNKNASINEASYSGNNPAVAAAPTKNKTLIRMIMSGGKVDSNQHFDSGQGTESDVGGAGAGGRSTGDGLPELSDDPAGDEFGVHSRKVDTTMTPPLGALPRHRSATSLSDHNADLHSQGGISIVSVVTPTLPASVNIKPLPTLMASMSSPTFGQNPGGNLTKAGFSSSDMGVENGAMGSPNKAAAAAGGRPSGGFTSAGPSSRRSSIAKIIRRGSAVSMLSIDTNALFKDTRHKSSAVASPTSPTGQSQWKEGGGSGGASASGFNRFEKRISPPNGRTSGTTSPTTKSRKVFKKKWVSPKDRHIYWLSAVHEALQTFASHLAVDETVVNELHLNPLSKRTSAAVQMPRTDDDVSGDATRGGDAVSPASMSGLLWNINVTTRRMYETLKTYSPYLAHVTSATARATAEKVAKTLSFNAKLSSAFTGEGTFQYNAPSAPGSPILTAHPPSYASGASSPNPFQRLRSAGGGGGHAGSASALSSMTGTGGAGGAKSLNNTVTSLNSSAGDISRKKTSVSASHQVETNLINIANSTGLTPSQTQTAVAAVMTMRRQQSGNSIKLSTSLTGEGSKLSLSATQMQNALKLIQATSSVSSIQKILQTRSLRQAASIRQVNSVKMGLVSENSLGGGGAGAVNRVQSPYGLQQDLENSMNSVRNPAGSNPFIGGVGTFAVSSALAAVGPVNSSDYGGGGVLHPGDSPSIRPLHGEPGSGEDRPLDLDALDDYGELQPLHRGYVTVMTVHLTVREELEGPVTIGAFDVLSSLFLECVLTCVKEFDGFVFSNQKGTTISVAWNAFSPFAFHEMRACECARHLRLSIEELGDTSECRVIDGEFGMGIATGRCVHGYCQGSYSTPSVVGSVVEVSIALAKAAPLWKSLCLVTASTYSVSRSVLADGIPVDVIDVEGVGNVVYSIGDNRNVGDLNTQSSVTVVSQKIAQHNSMTNPFATSSLANALTGAAKNKICTVEDIDPVYLTAFMQMCQLCFHDAAEGFKKVVGASSKNSFNGTPHLGPRTPKPRHSSSSATGAPGLDFPPTVDLFVTDPFSSEGSPLSALVPNSLQLQQFSPMNSVSSPVLRRHSSAISVHPFHIMMRIQANRLAKWCTWLSQEEDHAIPLCTDNHYSRPLPCWSTFEYEDNEVIYSVPRPLMDAVAPGMSAAMSDRGGDSSSTTPIASHLTGFTFGGVRGSSPVLRPLGESSMSGSPRLAGSLTRHARPGASRIAHASPPPPDKIKGMWSTSLLEVDRGDPTDASQSSGPNSARNQISDVSSAMAAVMLGPVPPKRGVTQPPPSPAAAAPGSPPFTLTTIVGAPTSSREQQQLHPGIQIEIPSVNASLSQLQMHPAPTGNDPFDSPRPNPPVPNLPTFQSRTASVTDGASALHGGSVHDGTSVIIISPSMESDGHASSVPMNHSQTMPLGKSHQDTPVAAPRAALTMNPLQLSVNPHASFGASGSNTPGHQSVGHTPGLTPVAEGSLPRLVGGMVHLCCQDLRPAASGDTLAVPTLNGGTMNGTSNNNNNNGSERKVLAVADDTWQEEEMPQVVMLQINSLKPRTLLRAVDVKDPSCTLTIIAIDVAQVLATVLKLSQEALLPQRSTLGGVFQQAKREASPNRAPSQQQQQQTPQALLHLCKTIEQVMEALAKLRHDNVVSLIGPVTVMHGHQPTPLRMISRSASHEQNDLSALGVPDAGANGLESSSTAAPLATIPQGITLVAFDFPVSHRSLASMIGIFQALPALALQRYARQMLLGLCFLHQQGLPHGSLSPDTVLVGLEGNCRLTGFGPDFWTLPTLPYRAPERCRKRNTDPSPGMLSTSDYDDAGTPIVTGPRRQTVAGKPLSPIEWTPPPPSMSADVWAFGMIVLAMLQGNMCPLTLPPVTAPSPSTQRSFLKISEDSDDDDDDAKLRAMERRKAVMAAEAEYSYVDYVSSHNVLTGVKNRRGSSLLSVGGSGAISGSPIHATPRMLGLSPMLQALLAPCFALNPQDRPTAHALLSHPYFM